MPHCQASAKTEHIIHSPRKNEKGHIWRILHRKPAEKAKQKTLSCADAVQAASIVQKVLNVVQEIVQCVLGYRQS